MTYSFTDLEPVCCSVSSSNYCFLTCIQISQKTGKVVWYSHLFKNFPQFIVIQTVKGSGVVNIAEVCGFLKLPAFSVIHQLLAICVGSDGKETASNAEDPVSIPGSGRSPGDGKGCPLEYSCLENSMDGILWAIVHGVTKSRTQLSCFYFIFICRSLRLPWWLRWSRICNARDPGLIPGLGSSFGEENGFPLQYSCLESSVDRGAWWATVHRVAESQTRLSEHAHSTKDYRIIKLSELE